MSFRELVIKTRTYRRYHQDVPVSMETLRELVDLARLSPCGMNMQPLKYYLSCDAETNARIFSTLGWALRLKTWPGPSEGERPAAYVVILRDNEVRSGSSCDHTIAAYAIVLGATERGLGGCMFGTVKRDQLREALKIPPRYDILLVVAIGKPKEKVVLEPLPANGDTAYWRTPDGAHHVPKRALDDIIIS
jgi:nitroreductase